jgi:hypothetical protein
MDYLFHKTGPLKGKPRGYAFVEYANKEVSAVEAVVLRASQGGEADDVSFSLTHLCLLNSHSGLFPALGPLLQR